MNDLINKIKVLRDVNINNNVMYRLVAGGKWFIKSAYSIALFICSKRSVYAVLSLNSILLNFYNIYKNKKFIFYAILIKKVRMLEVSRFLNNNSILRTKSLILCIIVDVSFYLKSTRWRSLTLAWFPRL